MKSNWRLKKITEKTEWITVQIEIEHHYDLKNNFKVFNDKSPCFFGLASSVLDC